MNHKIYKGRTWIGCAIIGGLCLAASLHGMEEEEYTVLDDAAAFSFVHTANRLSWTKDNPTQKELHEKFLQEAMTTVRVAFAIFIRKDRFRREYVGNRAYRKATHTLLKELDPDFIAQQIKEGFGPESDEHWAWGLHYLDDEEKKKLNLEDALKLFIGLREEWRKPKGTPPK